jgi:hypothetical protein
MANNYQESIQNACNGLDKVSEKLSVIYDKIKEIKEITSTFK